MKRLLVTGGAGFIGANFCHYWANAHPSDRLVVLDALTYAGNLASIAALEAAGALRFVHGDIGDGALAATLLREERIDTIVNFAAESHGKLPQDQRAWLPGAARGCARRVECARRA